MFENEMQQTSPLATKQFSRIASMLSCTKQKLLSSPTRFDFVFKGSARAKRDSTGGLTDADQISQHHLTYIIPSCSSLLASFHRRRQTNNKPKPSHPRGTGRLIGYVRYFAILATRGIDIKCHRNRQQRSQDLLTTPVTTLSM